MKESASAFTLVEQGEEYALFGAAGDAAFRLCCKTEQRAANIQGEDAKRFQTDYEILRRQYPDWPPDRILAQLWDQGGYGWLAEENA